MRAMARLAILAALAAAAAGTTADTARGDGMDDLAGGEWQGKATWKEGLSGDGEETAPPGPAPNPTPSTGGTPSPGTGPDGTDGSGEEPGDDGLTGGTAPVGPEGGTGDEEPGDPPMADPGTAGTGPGPATGPTSPNPDLKTAYPGCGARWVLEEEPCDPKLVDRQTALTCVLFRNDSYAFICNAYARALSTWYTDWVCTTEASEDGTKEYRVLVRLEQECENCNPEIDLIGLAALQAKAKVKALWGGVSGGCSASASGGSTWAGDLDCSADVAAEVKNGSYGSESEVSSEGVKFTHDASPGLVYQEANASESDSQSYQKNRSEVHVQTRASVHVYADDVDNVVQAKARVGHEIKIDGRSACGAFGTFDLVLESK